MKRKYINSIIGVSLFAVLFLAACTSQKTNEVTDKIIPDTSSENTENQQGQEANTETDIVYPPAVFPGDDVKPIDWTSGEKPTGEQLKFSSMTYDFSDEYYGNNIVLNAFGQFITAEDIQVRKVNDTLTGQVIYYSAYYKTYTPIEREYYTDYEIHQFSKLYSTDGELLTDWKECVIYNAFGDWALISPFTDINYSSGESDWDGYLLNIKTGEKIKNITSIDVLDREYIFASRSDGVFYILDKEGNIIKNSDEYEQYFSLSSYAYVKDNFIVVQCSGDSPSDMYFFNADGSMIGYIKDSEDIYVYNEMTSTPYFSLDYKIYDIRTGNGGELQPVIASSEGHYAAYYDGEVAIYRDSDGMDGYNDTLYDMTDNTPISKTYKEIKSIDKYYLGDAEYDPIQYFYGIRDNGIDKLDRKGNVVSSVDVPNVYFIQINVYGIDSYNEDYEDHHVFDLDLNETDLGRYDSIYPLCEYIGNNVFLSDLYVGSYSLDENHYRTRYDILNSDGKPVVTGASRVGAVVDGTIAVTKGLSVGAMDYNGNWLMKYDKNDFTNAD